MGRSGGAMVSTVVATSSRSRSFLESSNANLYSFVFGPAIREMQCWQWEEQCSRIRFITEGWPRFQRGITGREVGVGVMLDEDQTQILSVWKSYPSRLGLIFFFSRRPVFS